MYKKSTKYLLLFSRHGRFYYMLRTSIAKIDNPYVSLQAGNVLYENFDMESIIISSPDTSARLARLCRNAKLKLWTQSKVCDKSEANEVLKWRFILQHINKLNDFARKHKRNDIKSSYFYRLARERVTMSNEHHKTNISLCYSPSDPPIDWNENESMENAEEFTDTVEKERPKSKFETKRNDPSDLERMIATIENDLIKIMADDTDLRSISSFPNDISDSNAQNEYQQKYTSTNCNYDYSESENIHDAKQLQETKEVEENIILTENLKSKHTFAPTPISTNYPKDSYEEECISEQIEETITHQLIPNEIEDDWEFCKNVANCRSMYSKVHENFTPIYDVLRLKDHLPGNPPERAIPYVVVAPEAPAQDNDEVPEAAPVVPPPGHIEPMPLPQFIQNMAPFLRNPAAPAVMHRPRFRIRGQENALALAYGHRMHNQHRNIFARPFNVFLPPILPQNIPIPPNGPILNRLPLRGIAPHQQHLRIQIPQADQIEEERPKFNVNALHLINPNLNPFDLLRPNLQFVDARIQRPALEVPRLVPFGNYLNEDPAVVQHEADEADEAHRLVDIPRAEIRAGEAAERRAMKEQERNLAAQEQQAAAVDAQVVDEEVNQAAAVVVAEGNEVNAPENVEQNVNPEDDEDQVDDNILVMLPLLEANNTKSADRSKRATAIKMGDALDESNRINEMGFDPHGEKQRSMKIFENCGILKECEVTMQNIDTLLKAFSINAISRSGSFEGRIEGSTSARSQEVIHPERYALNERLLENMMEQDEISEKCRGSRRRTRRLHRIFDLLGAENNPTTISNMSAFYKEQDEIEAALEASRYDIAIGGIEPTAQTAYATNETSQKRRSSSDEVDEKNSTLPQFGKFTVTSPDYQYFAAPICEHSPSGSIGSIPKIYPRGRTTFKIINGQSTLDNNRVHPYPRRPADARIYRSHFQEEPNSYYSAEDALNSRIVNTTDNANRNINTSAESPEGLSIIRDFLLRQWSNEDRRSSNTRGGTFSMFAPYDEANRRPKNRDT